MDTIFVPLIVITVSSVVTTLCLLCVIIGRRKRARSHKFRYPSSDEVIRQIPDEVLEEDAGIYDIADRKANELLERLKALMEEQKPFLDPKSTIEDVSNGIGTNKTTLSKLINDKFGMNFRQLLNSYRVKEAITLLSKDSDISMDDLRIKSGFNSTTTFTTSFARFTGCTPGEYCKKVTGK